MTAIVWANILLAMPFILIWVGVPLWMTLKPRAAGRLEPQLVG
jgi:hypothetical protein